MLKIKAKVKRVFNCGTSWRKAIKIPFGRKRERWQRTNHPPGKPPSLIKYFIILYYEQFFFLFPFFFLFVLMALQDSKPWGMAFPFRDSPVSCSRTPRLYVYSLWRYTLCTLWVRPSWNSTRKGPQHSTEPWWEVGPKCTELQGQPGASFNGCT